MVGRVVGRHGRDKGIAFFDVKIEGVSVQRNARYGNDFLGANDRDLAGCDQSVACGSHDNGLALTDSFQNTTGDSNDIGVRAGPAHRSVGRIVGRDGCDEGGIGVDLHRKLGVAQKDAFYGDVFGGLDDRNHTYRDLTVCGGCGDGGNALCNGFYNAVMYGGDGGIGGRPAHRPVGRVVGRHGRDKGIAFVYIQAQGISVDRDALNGNGLPGSYHGDSTCNTCSVVSRSGDFGRAVAHGCNDSVINRCNAFVRAAPYKGLVCSRFRRKCGNDVIAFPDVEAHGGFVQRNTLNVYNLVRDHDCYRTN